MISRKIRNSRFPVINVSRLAESDDTTYRQVSRSGAVECAQEGCWRRVRMGEAEVRRG